MLRVTDILEANGMTDDMSFVPMQALHRGRSVHRATELDDLGRLDESTVHEAVAPYLESWRRFRSESGVEIVSVEVEVCHKPMGYAGRLDRIIRWNGELLVVDLKCGAPATWHPLQTAGYGTAYAHQESVARPMRGTIYLRDDGRTAVYSPHKDRSNYNDWKHCVGVAHFKFRNKMWAPKERTD